MDSGVLILVGLGAMALAYVAVSVQAGRWGRAGVVVWIIGSQAFLYWEPTGPLAIVARVALLALALALAIYAAMLLRRKPGEAAEAHSS